MNDIQERTISFTKNEIKQLLSDWSNVLHFHLPAKDMMELHLIGLDEFVDSFFYEYNLQYQDPPGTFEGIPDTCDG